MKRLVLVLLLAALLPFGPVVHSAGATEPPIRMAVLQSDIHQLAFWVAMEKGFFTKNGVSVEVAGVFKAATGLADASGAAAANPGMMPGPGTAPGVPGGMDRSAYERYGGRKR